MTVPSSAKYQIIHEMLLRDNNKLNVTWLCARRMFPAPAIITILRQRILEIIGMKRTSRIS